MPELVSSERGSRLTHQLHQEKEAHASPTEPFVKYRPDVVPRGHGAHRPTVALLSSGPRLPLSVDDVLLVACGPHPAALQQDLSYVLWWRGPPGHSSCSALHWVRVSCERGTGLPTSSPGGLPRTSRTSAAASCPPGAPAWGCGLFSSPGFLQMTTPTEGKRRPLVLRGGVRSLGQLLYERKRRLAVVRRLCGERTHSHTHTHSLTLVPILLTSPYCHLEASAL